MHLAELYLKIGNNVFVFDVFLEKLNKTLPYQPELLWVCLFLCKVSRAVFALPEGHPRCKESFAWNKELWPGPRPYRGPNGIQCKYKDFGKPRSEAPTRTKKIAIKTHWEMVFQTLEEIITFTLAFLNDERLFQLEINSCRSQWILTHYHLADFSFQLF